MNYKYNLININGVFFISLLPKELIKGIVKKGNFSILMNLKQSSITSNS